MVIEVDEVQSSENGIGLIGELRAAETRPKLELRILKIGDPESFTALVQGLGEVDIELGLAEPDEDVLRSAREVAKAIGATLRARFVFTPANWFEFEEVVRACARHEVHLDLRVLDRGGKVPLSALDLASLVFVKDTVVGAWPRCGGVAHPASLADYEFDQVCQDLRLQVRRQADLDSRKQDSLSGGLELPLPPIDHPWCTDAERAPWWHARLFSRGYLPRVRDWTIHACSQEGALGANPWLRALAHRVAFEAQPPELLLALRGVYQALKARKRLIADDRKFAEGFDLRRFGGPWADRVGLASTRKRVRPFAIGKRKHAQDLQTADLTVLIPSFRHERFIEETIQSALGQKYSNIRVLVVDDQSPDSTVARARAIDDPRLEVRVNSTNLGLGNSVLRALESIDTPYVALLNSDDLLHPEHLQRCRTALEENPEAQLVAADMALVDQSGGELTPDNVSLVLDGKQVFEWVKWFERTRPPEDLPKDDQFGALLERNYLVTSSNMVARTDWFRK
ncbi:MAG: glycosyltransferase family 2 protein, partial [Planctomycetes bacterium]|nr:glycosyltransferase family 2 protein [Planctomycetota bacterium]